jgi:hypothetical protein
VGPELRLIEVTQARIYISSRRDFSLFPHLFLDNEKGSNLHLETRIWTQLHHIKQSTKIDPTSERDMTIVKIITSSNH